MDRRGLPGRQWGALLWVAALAPAAELLPGIGLTVAGKGAWLTPGAAALVLLPVLLLARRGDGESLKQAPVGKVVLALCGVWMEILLVFRLILCARRMLWSGDQDGAVWFFILTVTALALWMEQGKLAVLGRAGQVYLAVLLSAAALVLGLSIPRVRADRILPLWTGDAVPVLLGALNAAGILSWAVLPMLLLPGEEREKKTVFLWGGGGCLLLTAAQIIVLGNLGVGLCLNTESGFFALTKSVGIEGAFQRVESVVAALWMISDLVLSVVLARAVGLAWEGVCAPLARRSGGSFALLAAAGLALWGTRWGAAVEEWNREWVWMGSLIACFGVSLAIFLVKKTKSP